MNTCALPADCTAHLKSSEFPGYFIFTASAPSSKPIRAAYATVSFVESPPRSGIFPPLNNTQWEQAFLLYKEIPEYKLQNYSMSLDQFKTIYCWEFFHRFLGLPVIN